MKKEKTIILPTNRLWLEGKEVKRFLRKIKERIKNEIKTNKNKK